jgi:hypothetical protein
MTLRRPATRMRSRAIARFFGLPRTRWADGKLDATLKMRTRPTHVDKRV